MITTKEIYSVQQESETWRVTGPGINFYDLRSGGFHSEEKAKEMARLFSLLWAAGYEDGRRMIRRELRTLLGAASVVESDDPN